MLYLLFVPTSTAFSVFHPTAKIACAWQCTHSKMKYRIGTLLFQFIIVEHWFDDALWEMIQCRPEMNYYTQLSKNLFHVSVFLYYVCTNSNVRVWNTTNKRARTHTQLIYNLQLWQTFGAAIKHGVCMCEVLTYIHVYMQVNIFSISQKWCVRNARVSHIESAVWYVVRCTIGVVDVGIVITRAVFLHWMEYVFACRIWAWNRRERKKKSWKSTYMKTNIGISKWPHFILTRVEYLLLICERTLAFV